MEYGSQENPVRYTGGLDQCVEAERALDAIGPLVELVVEATRDVERFVNRFHGAPTQLRTAGEKPAPPSGHLGRIKALRVAVDELRGQVSALDSIG